MKNSKTFFTQLSSHEKRDLLIKIFDNVKNKYEIYHNILTILKKNKNIPEKYLDELYEGIQKVVSDVDWKSKQKEINKLKKIKDQLEKVREKEKIEKLDENPDSLLDQI